MDPQKTVVTDDYQTIFRKVKTEVRQCLFVQSQILLLDVKINFNEEQNILFKEFF